MPSLLHADRLDRISKVECDKHGMDLHATSPSMAQHCWFSQRGLAMGGLTAADAAVCSLALHIVWVCACQLSIAAWTAPTSPWLLPLFNDGMEYGKA